MHAVVRTGGKQYRVTVGDIFEVEKLDGEVGEVISLDDVLLVSNGDGATIGQPTVEGASVQAKITGQHRGKKLISFRYRPKKRIRVRRGHRQYLTRLEIESISHGGTVFNERPAAPAVTVEAEPEVEEVVEEVMAAPASANLEAADLEVADADTVEAMNEDALAEVEAIEPAASEETADEDVASDESSADEASASASEDDESDDKA